MSNETIINQPNLIKMSVIKLFFLLIITLTLYVPFWFYYKWKYLRDIKGEKVKPLLLTLSTGIPFVGIIPQYFLYKELLNFSLNWNGKIIKGIAFSLSLLWFIALYIIFLYKHIYSSVLFSIFFYIPAVLILQAILNRKEAKDGQH